MVRIAKESIVPTVPFWIMGEDPSVHDVELGRMPGGGQLSRRTRSASASRTTRRSTGGTDDNSAASGHGGHSRMRREKSERAHRPRRSRSRSHGSRSRSRSRPSSRSGSRQRSASRSRSRTTRASNTASRTRRGSRSRSSTRRSKSRSGSKKRSRAARSRVRRRRERRQRRRLALKRQTEDVNFYRWAQERQMKYKLFGGLVVFCQILFTLYTSVIVGSVNGMLSLNPDHKFLYVCCLCIQLLMLIIALLAFCAQSESMCVLLVTTYMVLCAGSFVTLIVLWQMRAFCEAGISYPSCLVSDDATEFFISLKVYGEHLLFYLSAYTAVYFFLAAMSLSTLMHYTGTVDHLWTTSEGRSLLRRVAGYKETARKGGPSKRRTHRRSTRRRSRSRKTRSRGSRSRKSRSHSRRKRSSTSASRSSTSASCASSVPTTSASHSNREVKNDQWYQYTISRGGSVRSTSNSSHTTEMTPRPDGKMIATRHKVVNKKIIYKVPTDAAPLKGDQRQPPSSSNDPNSNCPRAEPPTKPASEQSTAPANID